VLSFQHYLPNVINDFRISDLELKKYIKIIILEHSGAVDPAKILKINNFSYFQNYFNIKIFYWKSLYYNQLLKGTLAINQDRISMWNNALFCLRNFPHLQKFLKKCEFTSCHSKMKKNQVVQIILMLSFFCSVCLPTYSLFCDSISDINRIIVQLI